jgi:hypothetical protein
VLSIRAGNRISCGVSLRFEVRERSNVVLALFDLNGRLIRELAGGMFSPGEYTEIWDLTDAKNVRVAPGVYIVSVIGDKGYASLAIPVCR